MKNPIQTEDFKNRVQNINNLGNDFKAILNNIEAGSIFKKTSNKLNLKGNDYKWKK